MKPSQLQNLVYSNPEFGRKFHVIPSALSGVNLKFFFGELVVLFCGTLALLFSLLWELFRWPFSAVADAHKGYKLVRRERRNQEYADYIMKHPEA